MRWGLAAMLCAIVLGLGVAAAVGAGSPDARGAPELAFASQPIPQGAFAQVTRANGVGDVNGDGRPDVVVAGDSYLVWFENPTWRPHLIARGGFGTGSTVALRDLDGDGRLDVLTGVDNVWKMAWFANTAQGWVRHTLSESDDCHHLDFADLDSDGREDIACVDPTHQRVVWLERPSDPTALWSTHVVDPARGVWGVHLVDLDRDGNVDIVAGRAWYRNAGAGRWVRYPYTTLADAGQRSATWPGSFFDDYEELTLADLNGDGRLDVFAALFAGSPEGQVHAFLSPPDPRAAWTDVLVDSGPLFSVHTLAAADYDGSGRFQAMVAEMPVAGYDFGSTPDPRTLVYRLEGPAQEPSSWERTVVDKAGMHAGVAADVDGDGRIDFVGGEDNSDRRNPPANGVVQWWRNETQVGAPAALERPRLAGAPVAGGVLTASRGGWSHAPATFRYEWRRCASQSASSCRRVPAPNDAEYALGADDVGKRIRVVVTATNSAGSATAGSALSGPVEAAGNRARAGVTARSAAHSRP